MKPKDLDLLLELILDELFQLLLEQLTPEIQTTLSATD
jgi:hypothetical protein